MSATPVTPVISTSPDTATTREAAHAVMRALSKKPEERFETAGEMVEAMK